MPMKSVWFEVSENISNVWSQLSQCSAMSHCTGPAAPTTALHSSDNNEFKYLNLFNEPKHSSL